MKTSKTFLIIAAVAGVSGLLMIACCGVLGYVYWSAWQPRPLPYDEGTDLALARSGFTTTLLRVGQAPQEYENESPPTGVSLVQYSSGSLQLDAWLSDDPGDGASHPAVVYLHGGWAFGGADWDDAAPFVDAGFVLMMPMLRAENGNPGSFEHVYGEVDDAVAAGEFVASLPYVEPGNIFVAGHSAGAQLASLVAMMPSKYKAAALLSGDLDYEDFISSEWGQVMPYDRSNAEERRLRNPMAFVASLRCPVYLFVESDNPFMHIINQRFVNKAQALSKQCQLFRVPGDHLSMVEPAVQQTIPLFRQHLTP